MTCQFCEGLRAAAEIAESFVDGHDEGAQCAKNICFSIIALAVEHKCNTVPDALRQRCKELERLYRDACTRCGAMSVDKSNLQIALNEAEAENATLAHNNKWLNQEYARDVALLKAAVMDADKGWRNTKWRREHAAAIKLAEDQ